MWFVLDEDIEGTFLGNLSSGALLSQAELLQICKDHDGCRAHCFATKVDAEVWAATSA